MAYVDKRVRGERRIANLSMDLAAPGVEHHAHRVISFHHPAQRMGGIAWLRLHLIPQQMRADPHHVRQEPHWRDEIVGYAVVIAEEHARQHVVA